MRINPFSKVERESSNHCRGDCSYINDFGSGAFERVCQLDSYSAHHMICAGVEGYEEGKYGEVDAFNTHFGSEHLSWAEIGNKDFVALWIEGSVFPEDDTKIFGIYNHDGKYYLTTCNITKLKVALNSNKNLHISDRMFDGIVKAVGDYWLA
jgi:hypothetical protein